LSRLRRIRGVVAVTAFGADDSHVFFGGALGSVFRGRNRERKEITYIPLHTSNFLILLPNSLHALTNSSDPNPGHNTHNASNSISRATSILPFLFPLELIDEVENEFGTRGHFCYFFRGGAGVWASGVVVRRKVEKNFRVFDDLLGGMGGCMRAEDERDIPLANAIPAPPHSPHHLLTPYFPSTQHYHHPHQHTPALHSYSLLVQSVPLQSRLHSYSGKARYSASVHPSLASSQDSPADADTARNATWTEEAVEVSSMQAEVEAEADVASGGADGAMGQGW